MNLYFLVEGVTERKIYPKWLKFLLPNFSRIDNASLAINNNYFLISGGGYPSILDNHLRNSIEEVNEYGIYDWLILVIDVDDMTEQEKIAEVQQFISDEKLLLNNPCHLSIITQKCCMETWFLGNSKVYSRNASSDFIKHSQFYDVSQQDPELMLKPTGFNESVSIYHECYLKAMLKERNISYSKAKPDDVGEYYYFEQLQKRINDTPHLTSLKNFFEFCHAIQ